MNYNEVVSSLRELARDFLRLNMVNARKGKILALQNQLIGVTATIATITKRIAVSQYHLDKIDPAQPDADVLTERYTEDIKDDNERLASYQKEVADFQGTIDEVTADIAKVQSGEYKVNSDVLNAKTDELISIYINNQVGK